MGGTGGTAFSPDASISSDASAAPLGKGAACTTGGECASTDCIDGVCCESACAGCSACSSALTGKEDGTCAPVTTGQDPHDACSDETATKECGNDGTCDGKGACRKVGASHVCRKASCSTDGKSFIAAGTCDGIGACSPASPQDCGGFQCAETGCLKTCSQQADCDKGSYCDTAKGTCTAQKPNGQAATAPYECTSGVVADAVCCDKACTGCSACTAELNGQAANTTGQCLPVKAGNAAPHGACTPQPPCGLDGKCDGVGACRYTPANTSCAADACSGSTLTKSGCDSSHACTPTATPCPGGMTCTSATACRSAQCTVDSDCASGNYCAAGTCSPKLAAGSPCSSATANRCSTGSCVDDRCCGVASCGTCQSCTGAGGTCVGVTNAEDPDTCSGASLCNATGACKTKAGQTCPAGGGTQCLSGTCADGVCCDRACTGSCEYCNGSTPGTCNFVTGAPKSGHSACAGTGLCGGTCNGSKATCNMPGNETTCRQPSCSGSTATNQAVCDGQGNCPAPSTSACNPFLCGTGSCLTTCSNSNQCVSGAACIGGSCVPCPAGQSVCGNACVNLQTDASHCGNCTTACTSGLCLNSSCAQCTQLSHCPSGYQACNSTTHTCVCRQKDTSNLLANPGFDGSATGWTMRWGASYQASADADACPASGSILLSDATHEVEQCRPASPNTFYAFGFKFKASGPGSEATTVCNMIFYAGTDCTTPSATSNSTYLSPSSDTNTWVQADSGAISPPDTGSVLLGCAGQFGFGYHDQFYLSTSNDTF